MLSLGQCGDGIDTRDLSGTTGAIKTVGLVGIGLGGRYMSETKYKVGFLLVEAICLNCQFHLRNHSKNLSFFDLKEEIFAFTEGQHSISGYGQTAGCENRELQIIFSNAVREIPE